MKFLVMSDNHGRYLKVQEVIDTWRDKVEYIFHTGDTEFPSDDVIWDKVDGVVTGNMDFDRGYRKQMVVSTPVGNVFLEHGHLLGVNRGYKEIFEAGKKQNADFIFHGHTHRLYAEYIDGVLLMNPGSLNQSRGEHPERTFAVVDVLDEKIEIQFYDDESQPIERLHYVFNR